MNFETWFVTQFPAIPLSSVASVLELAGEGATVPFIARYRKEKTGNLDEVAIRDIISAKENFDEIVKRQLFILTEIDKQGKLVPDLRDKILATFRLETLEDIYLPFKQKRKTKAMLAKEAGLEPLSNDLWDWAHGAAVPADAKPLETYAAKFINAEKKIPDAAAALAGAQDIIVERLAEKLELREHVRKMFFERGHVIAKKGEKAKTPSQYENYFAYSEAAKSLAEARNTHRYLALRRGWTEEELIVSVGGAPADAEFEALCLNPFLEDCGAKATSPGSEILTKAARLALKGHVWPSIEAEVHKQLKENSDAAAIHVFAENVGNLLLAAPFGPKPVVGIDPGIRSGCKCVALEASGKLAKYELIHLQGEGEKKRAAVTLVGLVQLVGAKAVAVGNGTAGRETERFARDALKEAGLASIPVVMVSEAGASVYSASDVAREEFPDLDLTVRGAVSIARRLQDPLAELVKIDPKSIGVGQYQHDVSQPALKKSLSDVVDSCVNRVGVNLNTASQHLLSHVSGIGPALAKAVVEHRGEKGLFTSRAALLEVPRFSKKTFEQASGFLRVPESANPLDNTGVHPERYELLEALAHRLGKELKDLVGEGVKLVRDDAELLKAAGEFTRGDIVAELEKPGRDPREEFVPFSFSDGINEMSDLKMGMTCPGIVTNVTNFGAFVDIGVHQDGLVHISQLADRFVKDPHEVVKPGDRVEVRVIEIKLDRKQIGLSMRKHDAPAPRQHAEAGEGRPQQRPQSQRPMQDRGGGAPRHAGGGGAPRQAGGGGQGPRGPGSAPRGPGGAHGPRASGGGGFPPRDRNDRNDGPRGGGDRAPQRSFGGGGGGGGSSGGGFRVNMNDPNNPFAKLAALKTQLDKGPGGKKGK